MLPAAAAILFYFISGFVVDAQVAVTAPFSGSVFSNAQIVAIQATVATNVREVDFYDGQIKKAAITNTTNNIFICDWIMTSASNGTNEWTAIALDSAGQNAWTSSVVSVAVKIPESLPPVILVQPRNRKVVIGRIATFSVIADGTPPLAYQWFFDGAALTGGTAATLKLTGVTTNIAGNYFVAVSNAYGVVSSRPAVLKVVKPLPPPSGFRIAQ